MIIVKLMRLNKIHTYFAFKIFATWIQKDRHITTEKYPTEDIEMVIFSMEYRQISPKFEI